jgi:membrane-associated phospholipid phosphatase
MPLYMVLLLLFIHTNGAMAVQTNLWIYVIFIVIINSLVVPISIIWLMKRMKIISSMSMEEKQDRLYPFFVTLIFYVTTWYIFRGLNIISYLSFIFAAASILLALAISINAFWKISIHSISMGAVSAAILILTASHYLMAPWLVYSIFILSGMVGFARLKLQAHSPMQVYSGFLLGLAVLAAMMILL